MLNVGTLWVVINASEAQEKLVGYIDSGSLAEAIVFSNALNDLIEKMKKFVQQYGGSIPLYLYERIIMQLPSSVVENLPYIIKGYSESLNGKIAVGIGLTMEEASNACKKSKNSGEIELYDPEDKYGETEDFIKNDSNSRRFKGVTLPPNIFDPTIPDESQYARQQEVGDIKILSIKEALQAEASLVEAMAGPMGLDQLKQMQQQQEAAAQQQQQAEQQPRDLLESLNGGQIDGHQPEENEDSTKESENSTSNEDSGDVEEVVQEIEEAEQATSDDKIAMQLDKIKTQIPQIMGLAEKDPKAFKQTMDMINKLIQLAHNRSKTTEKSETRNKIESLIKDINMRAKSDRPKTNGIIYPVGTRLGRYKKVLVDGKQKWREMSSGQVLDDKGTVISVKENNKQAGDNQREEDNIDPT